MHFLAAGRADNHCCFNLIKAFEGFWYHPTVSRPLNHDFAGRLPIAYSRAFRITSLIASDGTRRSNRAAKIRENMSLCCTVGKVIKECIIITARSSQTY